MIKCCIFDLDGTLLDTLEDLANCCNAALREHDFPMHNIDKYRHMVGNGVEKLVERALPSDAEPGSTAAVKISFDKLYAEHFMDNTSPYTGIDELLTVLKIKGVKTAVLSNKPQNFTSALIKSIFGIKYFDAVVGARDGVSKKPSPDGVLLCIKELSVLPQECVLIGDSDVDVETAKNAGIRCVGAQWGFRGRDELLAAGADYIAASPRETAAILNKM